MSDPVGNFVAYPAENSYANNQIGASEYCQSDPELKLYWATENGRAECFDHPGNGVVIDNQVTTGEQ